METLAVKYRPKTFDDVVAQTYVKEILLNQLEAHETKNGYLFCGSAGCGKTSASRIFANELNEGKGSPIELDAASKNGVSDIREIIEDSKYKSIDSKYKIYIIDEVHMLSTGAFNALLKTLEEPPSGTVFILCTTDPQKIPATILSRVQRFDFTKLENEQIVDRLTYIIESENANEGASYKYELEALEFIAKLSGGGMRDAISRLEKVLGYSDEISVQNVSNALGAPDYDVYLELINCIANNEPTEALNIIDSIYMSGKDLKLAMRNFTDFTLDVTRYILTETLDNTQIPTYMLKSVQEATAKIDYLLILWILEELNKLNNTIKWEPNPKPIVDLQLLLMTREED